jgi:S-DNA-T family DNA segregation ATPase FtsK/SpoIIIE
MRVLVGGSGEEPQDVVVEVEPDHTVADVTAALAAHLGGPAKAELRSNRLGEVLDPDAAVLAAGLADGDHLELAAAGRKRASRSTKAEPVVELVVAAGPDAGLRVPLAEGVTVVGRSVKADVTLADVQVSRRHLRVTVEGTTVTVADEGSSNGTFVEGAPVAAPLVVGPTDQVEIGTSLLRFEGAGGIGQDPDQSAAAAHAPTPRPVDGIVGFNRPPRMAQPAKERLYTLEAPPGRPKKNRIPMSSAVAPLIMGVVMALAFKQTSFLAFALLSPVVAVWSHLENKRGGHRDFDEQRMQFYAQLAAMTERMAAARDEEAVARRHALPDPAELQRRAERLEADLWERRPRDDDFLTLRVGWRDLPSTASFEIAKGGEDDLRREAELELETLLVGPSVPVPVSLRDAGVVGLAGPPADVDGMARWLLLQLATLHSPRDLVIAVITTEARAEALTWCSWLPHLGGDGSPIEGDHLVTDVADAKDLLERLGSMVATRREATEGRLGRPAEWSPTVVLVVDEQVEVPRASIATILEHGPGVGVSTLWLGERGDLLPGECGAIVTVRGPHTKLIDPRQGDVVDQVNTDIAAPAAAEAAARALAPARDVSSGSGATQVPSRVGVLDLLDLPDPKTEDIVERWRHAERGLRAPIGRGAASDFVLDMRRDGPHGLLGGTTGAGKSELLQTVVASMAVHHRPDQLAFILVDYKGGAAFKDCVALPHVIGFVTDLDGHLVHRALVSLNAELHRRERLLARLDAKDIVEAERKAPDEAPANLLLVIDEFAALAKELPEFVEGMVDVAQRGRSLGIHLILATQRPAGVINDNIRANTNLRMALRMNDASDSQDVLDAKDAALLPRHLPGRAYARTGHGELTLFQVAYSGGHTPPEGAEVSLPPVRVHPVEHGRAVVTATPGGKGGTEEGATDLERIVVAVRGAHEALGTVPERPPWLPELPEQLPLATLPAPEEDRAVLGLVDLPTRQAQELVHLDLDRDGSLLVYGTGGAGKTTLLRSIAVSLAERSTPERLHLYALDFASRGLTSLEALPHCGAVIPGDDVDRVQRLFGLLDQAMAERREAFTRAGVTNLPEYRAKGEPEGPLPRVVVLLDGYGGFASTFEKVDFGARLDAFPQLVSEGRSLGIHVVATASSRSVVPMGLASAVPTVLVLRMASPDDYATIGLDHRATKDVRLPPGRGFTGDSLELQCPLVGDDPAGEAQMEAVAVIGRDLTARHGPGTAARIGSLPTELTRAELAAADAPMRPVIGVGGLTLGAVAVDLDAGHLLVAGPIQSGKSTALATIATGLRHADPDLELILMAPRRSPLTELAIWTTVATGADDCASVADDLRRTVEDRELGAESHPVVVVVDDGGELVDTMADSTLAQVVKRGRDTDVTVVAAVEAPTAHRAYSGFVPELRKDRHGILLRPDPDLDGDLLGVDVPRSLRGAPPGRGILATRQGATVVQVAIPDDTT